MSRDEALEQASKATTKAEEVLPDHELSTSWLNVAQAWRDLAASLGG